MTGPRSFADALERSREMYNLGRDGWFPKFVATSGGGLGSGVRRRPDEPMVYTRADWASYRLGELHREQALRATRLTGESHY